MLATFVAGGAQAQSVAGEIEIYKRVSVNFSASAARCELTDGSIFESYLSDKLSGAGVKQADESAMVANLGISAQPFGLVGRQCAYYTELSFATGLPAENVVTNSARVRSALDRLKVVPITIYKVGFFGTRSRADAPAGGEGGSMEDAFKKTIDLMIDQFKKDRGG